MSEISPSNIMLGQDSKRTSGRDAQKLNILVAKEVAQTVRTTLGPKGMDKMIVTPEGTITVTNDGVTILEQMRVEHPVAKIMVEIAKSQEDRVGDGTTSCVVLAGELLKKAEDLLDQGIHPTVIARGYKLAENFAQKYLQEFAENVTLENEAILTNIAETAMTGKVAGNHKKFLSSLIIGAIKRIDLNRENILVNKLVGYGTDSSFITKGIVLEREIVHNSMPKQKNNCKIALINANLDVRDRIVEANINISDAHQWNKFSSQEEQKMKDMITKLVECKVDAIFCSKHTDEIVEYLIAKAGIIAVRRIKPQEMEKLSRLTNARIVNSLKELTNEDIGYAENVYEKTINNSKYIFVETESPKILTLTVGGSTEHIAEEIKRAVTDAIGDLVVTLQDGKAVGGAGAIEIQLARKIRDYASTLLGKEQLAVESFADSLEVIPKALAENSGLDPIEVLTNLRIASLTSKWVGINVFTGKVMDSWGEGVIEPLKVKTQALLSATEVAEMILRIDELIEGFTPNNINENPNNKYLDGN